MRIGDLARRSGVNIETIRYYERIGLVASPPRSAGGHRVYGQRHLNRLVFIRRGRELGFALDAVRDLLALVEGGHGCNDIRTIAAGHLTDIRQKIADLQRMERTLSDTIAECDAGAAPSCPVVEILSR